MNYFQLLILFLYIFCSTPTVLGQELEKEVKYADINGNYISKKEFYNCIKAGFIEKTAENDNYKVHYLSHNSFEGTLTETENKQTRLMINKIVGKEIDSSKAIVIHLYNKNDKQLKADIKNYRYWNWIKKILIK